MEATGDMPPPQAPPVTAEQGQQKKESVTRVERAKQLLARRILPVVAAVFGITGRVLHPDTSATINNVHVPKDAVDALTRPPVVRQMPEDENSLDEEIRRRRGTGDGPPDATIINVNGQEVQVEIRKELAAIEAQQPQKQPQPKAA